MTKQKRYLFFIGMTMVLGLLSRKFPFIPSQTGDALWAILIFWGLRWLFPQQTPLKTGLFALSFSYLIEWSQLLRWPWLLAIRQTTLGHLVLGQGFLLSDLFAYTIGVGLAALLENWIQKKDD